MTLKLIKLLWRTDKILLLSLWFEGDLEKSVGALNFWSNAKPSGSATHEENDIS
jgi:hypothetical protein